MTAELERAAIVQAACIAYCVIAMSAIGLCLFLIFTEPRRIADANARSEDRIEARAQEMERAAEAIERGDHLSPHKEE